ncbi:hypothetical protein GSI_06033 [Ganoderma sinense ZZ0214-1]|uniref:Transporter n=1 Tax=Ganoderma sinense ZZ0214-1 TaxID=1077348 RepID=A0A2G8SC41_9APHY|nr:hypothetical protein GSI_06033 [Ganoderma sinense ZZ0214-1]
MRLSSTSSSLILATLAVSSSSIALAAPTEPGALDESMAHSPSELQIIAMSGRSEQVASGLDPAPTSESDPIPAVMVEEMLARRGLTDILAVLGGVPIVGPVLVKLLGSLVNSLGLSLDAIQNNAVDAQSTPSLTPDQIRAVANVISGAHNNMQAIMAQQGGLNARGQIAEWDAVSSSPPAPSSSSNTSSATPSSTSSTPASSGNATSNAGSTAPAAPVTLPVPPNSPVPSAVTPPKVIKSPAFFAFASRMIPPVFIKAGQNDVEVSMSGGPAMTLTGNSSSTVTPAGGEATTLASATAVNSTSTSTSTAAP